MTKYKYYFKKPKTEITKDVLMWLATAGVLAVAATSPFFIVNLLRAFKRGKHYERKDLYNTFYYLRKRGYINMDKENNQMYISLTEEGKKKAGWFQINHLSIKKPKRWDRKWRIIIFDVEEKHRPKREAMRGLFKRLGLVALQKSAWVCPYECRDEIELLRDFFGFNENELRYIVTDDIGGDKEVKKLFNL